MRTNYKKTLEKKEDLVIHQQKIQPKQVQQTPKSVYRSQLKHDSRGTSGCDSKRSESGFGADQQGVASFPNQAKKNQEFQEFLENRTGKNGRED